jgi:phytanoyl-CoA hydroxylase
MNHSLNRFALDDYDNAKKFFDDNGYMIIKNFFTKEELNDFKCELRSIITAYMIKAKLAPLEADSDDIFTVGINQLESINHEYIAAVYDTIFQSPSFFRIVGNKSTEKTVKMLLGMGDARSLYAFTNRCLIAPQKENQRTYGWHQEVFYTIPKGKFIQTWAPLIFDTTVLNGTIQVATGSHKEGVAQQTWDEIEGQAPKIIIKDDIVNRYPKASVEMNVGELLFFSGYLAHRSGNNTSEQVRYSLVGMYHDVQHEPFLSPKISFQHRGLSPKQYYDQEFPS